MSRLRLWGTPAGWALAAFCVSIVLLYSRWWAWYGGDFWGPRFFLALSSWVGLNGVVFDQRSMDLCWQNNYELEFLCWYVPAFSALWRPFVTQEPQELLAAIWRSPQRAFALWQVVTWSYLTVSLVRRR